MTTPRVVLAKGTACALGDGWHKLGLRCVGDCIVAPRDGSPIARIQDSTYQRKLVGLVSRFHAARLNNLHIASPCHQS